VTRNGDQEPVTSRHLDAIADRVRSGAHVALRGHVGDDVLVADEFVEEARGIADALSRRAGIERVFVASQADGLYGENPYDERATEAFFADVLKEHEEAYDDLSPVMYDPTPSFVASATRMLLRQTKEPVAIILRDASELFGGSTEQGQVALSTLIEAMVEARFVSSDIFGEVRNALVVYGWPDGPVIERIAGTPGVAEVIVEMPNRHERLAALRQMAPSFYRNGNDSKPTKEDLDALAELTDSYSLRELMQLGRSSHTHKAPASRPQTLIRRSRREGAMTRIGEVGVERIMKRLTTEIFGQQTALNRIHEHLTIGQWRPGNRPPGARATRPMATMVFHGPAGMGKTETALVLAEEIVGSREAIVRIDCAEIQNQHDIARLIGAPPGYVGHEDGGALTEALERDSAVILLDEFDQAPPLAELLLGILDAGRLTDGRGRTATFENALLLLTTNLGFRAGESRIRPDDPPTTEALLRRSHEKAEWGLSGEGENSFGSPALWSRLQGALIGYDILRPPAIAEMVERACDHLERNLADELDRRVPLDRVGFTAEIRSRLSDQFDGRGVAAEIRRTIETPARLWLANKPPPPKGREEPFGPAEAAAFYAAASSRS
jgi:hypothetical protein